MLSIITEGLEMGKYDRPCIIGLSTIAVAGRMYGHQVM
jgi:hypothetical protein